MKVITYKDYGPPEVLSIQEMKKPKPGDREILIRMEASTVTAVDSIFRAGHNFFARLATGLFKPKQHIPGGDYAGIVDTVGSQVTTFKPGEAVFGSTPDGFGAHAEFITVPQDSAIAVKPAALTFAEAASLPYGGLTALPFLRDGGKITKGQKILIIGASGSVGTSAVQLAKFFDAEVTGICSTKNVSLVRSLGADHVIDYKRENFLKNDRSYDVIFDAVGKSSFAKCKRVLEPTGIYLTTYISFNILFQMARTSLFGKKRAQIMFTGMRGANDKARDLQFIKTLAESNQLKPVIDSVFPMKEMRHAHAYVDSGHKHGNVVLKIARTEHFEKAV